jgi:2-aminoadipate transaminase
MEEVLRDEAAAALNYGLNPGYSLLRDWIAERMGTHERVQVTRENVLVSSGGVEALTLISMALLDAGDTVIVGAPTYLIALHVFRSFQANIESVRLDEEGMDTDELEQKLKELSAKGVRPKYIYVIPSFQNPSGLTMSAGRRNKIVEIAERHRVPIVEDHAYADLRFEGEKLPSLKSLAPEQVLFIHTFSKIFSPGVRLGWVATDAELIKKLGLCKIGTDSCANTLAQRLLYRYGSRGGVDRQVEASVSLYRRKRDRLLAALDKELGSKASWTTPAGGFYVWMKLPEGTDSEALLRRAIEEQKTAFVAGPPFFADGSGQNHLRLAYSFVPEDQIDEGIHRLAQAL